MSYIKCPKCDLNWITDDQMLCPTCLQNEQPTKSKGLRGTPKPRQESNIAFKCNYCNGGANNSQLGFSGACSKENIAENINIKKRTWCSDRDCKCAQYLNGKLNYEQIKDEFPCQESNMLNHWRADAGEDRKDGERRGRHRQVKFDTSNGLCILTTILPNKAEHERVIFGVYIVDKFDEGNEASQSGFVQCTSKYKIKLSPHESEKMLFWNYYFSPNEPDKITWASGLYRYISNEQSLAILHDIANIKKGTQDEKLAVEILDRFCTLKNKDKNDITERKVL